MLDLFLLRVCAAIVLVATVVGFLALRSVGFARPGTTRVVATNAPARWTEVAWVGGFSVTLLWPVGAFVVPTLVYHWPAFPDFPGSWIVQIVGLVLVVGGGLLLSTAARALGRHLTPAIQVRQGHQLVQSGPYRRVRHPLYTALLTLGLGQGLLFLSLPILALTVFMAGLAVYRARLEEDLLRSPGVFGARYDEYVARTGRFLPRFRSGARTDKR